MNTDNSFLIAVIIMLIGLIIVLSFALLKPKDQKMCEVEVKSTSVEAHVWIKPCREIKE